MARMHTGWRLGAAAGLFAAGFLCGAVSQRPAEAQLGDAAKGVMGQAAGQGGAVGAAAKLGTSIVEMQDHVTALQKNLDTLKGIKDALGG